MKTDMRFRPSDKPLTPTRVGYECAAMIRFRPGMVNSKRIERYPNSQWGDCYGIELPDEENTELCSARRVLQRRFRSEPNGR